VRIYKIIRNKIKVLLHKIFVYILIFSHLNWSTHAVASVILETYEQDNFRKESTISCKAPFLSFGNQRVNLQQDCQGRFHIHNISLPYLGSHDYFFGNKLIARATMSNSTFSFEGYDHYNFILDSCVRPGRASFKTGGSLIFQERVTLQSLDVFGRGHVTFEKAVSLKENAKISATNILFQEQTSAETLDLTSTNDIALQSTNTSHRLFMRAGGSIVIGSQDKSTVFDIIDDVGIRANKILNHSLFSSEIGRITFQAKEIENSKSAAIKAEGALSLKSDTLKNEGSIEGNSSTKLINQTFYNPGKVNITRNLHLANSNFFENKGEFTYGDQSVIKAMLLSNRGTWRAQGKSSLLLSESLYNLGNFNVSGETWLQTPLLANRGKLNFERFSDLKGASFKNSGDISISGLLTFTLTQDILNEEKGNLVGNGQLRGRYQNLHNKGKWQFEGTFVSEGQSLINDQKAQWKISKFWQHKSQELSLDGQVDTGSLAILDLERQARFLGFIQSHTLQVTSGCSITCTPSSSFDVTHHMNLDAKGLISFDSRILERKSTEDKGKPLSEDFQKFVRSLRRGIFLTAGQHLQKNGRIIAEHGSVNFVSNGDVKHGGLTESGVDEGNSTRLSANDLCEISGVVKSRWRLDINAKNSIRVASDAELNSQGSLSARALFVTNQGFIKGNDLHFKADRLFSNILGGVIEGRNTTVDALVSVNSLAYMTSRNLTINSALDLNAGGVRSAFNANINSLVILNAGLNLPRFDSWDDVFSKQNLQNAAHALITTFAPQSLCMIYNLGRSAWNLPGLVRDIKKLWNDARELSTRDDVGISDMMPLLCQGKSLATSAIQTASIAKTAFVSGKETISKGYNLYQEGKLGKTINDSVQTANNSVKELPNNIYQEYQNGKLVDHFALATGAVIGSLGPHYNTDSLLNVNMGINLGVNGYDRNLMSLNYGINGYANTYTLDTAYAQNNGVLAASRLRIDAFKELESTGGLFGLTGNINGGNLDLGGYVGFYKEFSASGSNISTDGVHLGQKLIYLARENLTTAEGSSISGNKVTAKAGKKALIEGEINGTDKIQAFGGEETTITSTGAVIGEKKRHVGVDFEKQKDETGNVTKKVIYSQKTNIEGLIKDTGNINSTTSSSLVGGVAVNVKGQVQSYGTSQVQGQNVHLHEDGSVIGDKGAYVLGTNVTHGGNVHANNGATLVMGTAATILNASSVTTGQYVSVGKTSSTTESTRSQKTEIHEGAQLEGENVLMAGDQLYSAAKINAHFAAFEANDGEVINLQGIQANTAHFDLGHYKGGAQGAIDMANQMTSVTSAYIDASQYDFINNCAQTIQGDQRIFKFKNVDNKAPINSDGTLGLGGIEGFRTTANIHAETGLLTFSTQGKHELLNGAVLSTTCGLNYVEANNGAVRESVILPDGTLKRAGITGDDVFCKIKGDCHDTASQILARNQYKSTVEGNQFEHALECLNKTVSINVDGSRDVLQSGEKATRTFARSEYGASLIEEDITGKLYTEAGVRYARNEGKTIAKGGIEAKALQHTYVAEKWDYRSGCCKHRKSQGFQEETDFYRPEFHSGEGQYNIASPEGKCELEAALFDVAKTSNVYGRDGVALTAAVARNHYRGYKSSGFGLKQTKYSGYYDTAQVADVIGKEKINIIYENKNGELILQSPNIDVAQGGVIYAPNGVRPEELRLVSHHKERKRGIFFDSAINRTSTTSHPIIQRVVNLAENRDGGTGAISDACGLATSAFNAVSHAAQTFNMNGNVTDFIASESGVTRTTLGYKNTSTCQHTTRNVLGRLRSGGDFVIQTEIGKETDLSNMQLDIKTLYLDSDKLKLGGSEQTFYSKEKSTQEAFSFDALSPTVITTSASHQSSTINSKMYTPTQNRIEQLHVIRPDSKIELQNANLTIDQSSGKNYQIQINDSQNETHTRGHHVGFSLGIDVTTGMPVSGGISVGKQDLHSYTIPHRSVAKVVQGDNIPSIIEDHKKDRTTGSAFALNYTQAITTEGASLSMPLSISGQVESTRFRVEPLVVSTTALKNDMATIAQASQSISDRYKKRDTREDVKEEVRNENISHVSVKDEQTQFASREEGATKVSDKDTGTSFILLDGDYKGDERDEQLDLLYTLRDGSSIALTAPESQNFSIAQSQEDESAHGTQAPKHTALVQAGIDLSNKISDEYAAASNHAQEVIEGKHSYIEAYEKETGQKFEDLNFFLQYSLLEADSNRMGGAIAFKVVERITPIALEGYSCYQGGLPYTVAKLAYNHYIAPSIYQGLANTSQVLSESLHKNYGLPESYSNDIGLVFNQIGTMTADRLSARMINVVSTYQTNGALLFNAKSKTKSTSDSLQAFELAKQQGTLTTKQQAWVVRPGQEYKEKIFGKAQKTGTEGHRIRTYRQAIEEAKKSDVEKVGLDLGYRKMTGENVPRNRRPDVTVVEKSGKVHAYEVPSKTDKKETLIQRNREVIDALPPERQGKVTIIEITKIPEKTVQKM